MPLTERQLQFRKNGIGASQTAALLGESSYQIPFDVWESIVLPTTPRSYSQAQQWGLHLEDAIREKWAITCGRKIIPGTETLQHKKYPHMLATPDGFYEDGEGLVEIKNVDKDKRLDWGAFGTDQIAKIYIPQGHQQLAVARSAKGIDYKYVDFVVLFGGNQGGNYRLYHDPDMDDLLGEFIEDWWARYIDTKTPPDVDFNSPQRMKFLQACYPKGNGNMVEIDEASDLYYKTQRLREVRLQLAALNSEKKGLENELRESIAENDGLATPLGNIYWKHTAGKRTLSQSALIKLAIENGVTQEDIENCKVKGPDGRKISVPRDWGKVEEDDE